MTTVVVTVESAPLTAAAGMGRSKSLHWSWPFDILRAKGYDKEKAAAIANSRLKFRKKGRLNVLPAKAAHNPAVLARLRKAEEAGKYVTGKQLMRK